MKNFLNFIREQGVVGLAIGFILGGAVTKVVSSLVEDIINPLIGLLLGSTKKLTAWKIQIADAQILLGNFLTILLDFIIIAFVVYFIFKGLKLDKIDKKKS